MTVDTAVARVLGRFSDEQIEALARATQRFDRPPSNLGELVAGAGPAAAQDLAVLSTCWDRTAGLTGAGVALALRTGLAARQAAGRRRSRPVWTGPEAVGEQRLTAGVLHELIASASERVLLVSFAAYTLPEVARDLQTAATRGCCVDVVFETREDSSGKYDGPGSAAFAGVDGIKRWLWPASHRAPGAVLHAKLLVVDRKRALVGSANLTGAALTKNLEAGVLVDDEDVAAKLDDHVGALMRNGVLVRECASAR